jgi:hypothetical protein
MYHKTKFDMPDKVRQKVNDWIGSDNPDIMHVWHDGKNWGTADAFYVTVLSEANLMFLRVFSIGPEWELSQGDIRLCDGMAELLRLMALYIMAELAGSERET